MARCTELWRVTHESSSSPGRAKMYSTPSFSRAATKRSEALIFLPRSVMSTPSCASIHNSCHGSKLSCHRTFPTVSFAALWQAEWCSHLSGPSLHLGSGSAVYPMVRSFFTLTACAYVMDDVAAHVPCATRSMAAVESFLHDTTALSWLSEGLGYCGLKVDRADEPNVTCRVMDIRARLCSDPRY